MVKFMSPWGPKEEAQIQAVESYAKLPRNGVRIRHKCWVGDTPPLFATCPWAVLPSPPSKCLPSILRLPDSHTGQASPVYTYSFTSTAGPDLASRSWYIDGVFLHALRLTWKWYTALLWWKWADSRDLWQPRVHSRFAFSMTYITNLVCYQNNYNLNKCAHGIKTNTTSFCHFPPWEKMKSKKNKQLEELLYLCLLALPQHPLGVSLHPLGATQTCASRRN